MTTTEPQSTKYAGKPQPGIDDPSLLTGSSTYMDDITVPRMIEGAVLRSPVAHARITRIDVSKARELPGVFDVITGNDLVEIAGEQPVIWYPIPEQRIARAHALATDTVRWVGQGVAAVAAVDRYVAEDALELIEVDYEPLPVVADLEQALAPDAPKLYEDWPDNVSGSMTLTAGDADAAFAEADVVVGASFRHHPGYGCPIETRGCISNWDVFSGRLDVWLGTQSPNLARELFAQVLSLPVSKIRVRTPEIGGGFGLKFDFYPEGVIAAILSRRSKRPVKLLEDRQESFVASSRSRDMRHDFEMALRSDGTILGLRGTAYGVLGGALGTVGAGPPWASVLTSMGPYKIPNQELTLKAVMTNRSPYGSYRGWGVPKGNIVHERLIELAARKLGMSRIELRRMNFPAPDEFPYFSGAAFTFDSGRYADCLDLATSAVEERGWNELQREGREAGRSIGIGYGFHIEPGAYGPSRVLNMVGLDHSGFDEVYVRMDSAGKVTVLSGQISTGQGTHTTYAQLVAEGLGVPIEDVTVVTGDTESCPYTGYGTGGSRAATLGGAAIVNATGRLKAKILRIGAELLEADPEDLELDNGRVSVRGAADSSVSTADIGYSAYRMLNGRLPESETPTLEEVDVFDPANMTTSYACTALLVEVDRQTGAVKLLDCLQAHDAGVIINPLLADGQLAGGLAQAFGGGLFEEFVYDDDGQIRTASFMDYLIPSATDIPPFHFYHQETPAPHIPGGMKGLGEAGTIAGVSVVGSAIDDALSDLGVTVCEFPMTPPRLLELIRAAQSGEATT
ncbi:xanthine dehydrogenase family protein molybdopterin-binding subunit [Haloechinothrix sp. YIM 98757]|uniref:Xanthine dehydrogenase family protein molybdopterin-binding subunit n=1 Tax=Haloechinothrix aidingensis TaxID=2752311 RepID=A0A838ADG6_9PSEU|nr:xanthine dehydrogenase family protein molybdopterin-binding subunit [Haloechinothrix aidingensis]MBA0127178.1 xanthine dehydrogenase family protein molybdopterin-binding subunit [Haloechinothrix aidingensis]